MSGEEVRPVHVVVDCSVPVGDPGHVVSVPLGDAQWEAQRAGMAAAAAAEGERLAQEEALRAAVAAHADPLVRLLAQRAGLA